MTTLHAFVAYPASPTQVAAGIVEAIRHANKAGPNSFTPWEENDIAGRPLTNPIFQSISASNLLVADITSLNFNVTYEVGYAIGVGRRVFLVRSNEYDVDADSIRKIGIFDTLGYETYDNSNALASILTRIVDSTPLTTTATPNHATPVYVLETPLRGTTMTHIISRVKKARLQYRSFVPSED